MRLPPLLFPLALALACGAPRTSPPDAAWAERPALRAFDARLERALSEGRLAGAVYLVQHRGELVAGRALGLADRERGVPMTPETVFRIFSMTKPVTSVAALQLIEAGRLDLDEAVEEYLPAFATARVLAPPGTGEETVPLERPVTVRDLLTHTSGLTYAFFEHPRLAPLYREAGLEDPRDDAREHAAKLAALPLQFQPGTAWQYGRSTDVLGAVVEVASGERLDDYLERHVFQPLGMKSTGFVVAPERRELRARLYELDEAGELVPVAWDEHVDAPRFCSGGGGLYSTARDYLRFATCLARGGELDGVRILRESSMEEMTRDHIAGLPRPRMLHDRGYGYGVAILTEESAGPETGGLGGFHWSGMGGTSFFVDPANDLVAVFLVQSWRDFSWMVDFRKSVYGASREAPAHSGSEVGE